MKTGTIKTKMPNQKPHLILLAVSGMSPQIITETLFGLMHRKAGAWLPDEIHLITTNSGREQARLQLLGEQGHFQQLLLDYAFVTPIKFDFSTIHVITGSDGTELEDLRTPQDNEAAADFITEQIRTFTSQDNTELHVSLAGGRKTMGFYIGYALSLFGRPQDRLSHVLVDAGYETLSNFFYPTPETRSIATRDGKGVLDASKAKVWLAEIPFVRLRGFLPDHALVNKARFSALVKVVSTLTGDPKLVVDIANLKILIGDIAIYMPPRELALYILFLKAVLSGDSPINIPKKGHIQLGKIFLEELQRIKGEMADLDCTAVALEKGMDRAYFDSIKSRINTTLEKALGKQGATQYQIQSGSRGSATFWLSLPKNRIAIEE